MEKEKEDHSHAKEDQKSQEAPVNQVMDERTNTKRCCAKCNKDCCICIRCCVKSWSCCLNCIQGICNISAAGCMMCSTCCTGCSKCIEEVDCDGK